MPKGKGPDCSSPFTFDVFTLYLALIEVLLYIRLELEEILGDTTEAPVTRRNMPGRLTHYALGAELLGVP
jgi:hypothetical protein